MRILLVSNLFPPRARGGAEQVARSIAQTLRDLGHDVHVLTTQPQGALACREEEGLSIWRFRPSLPYDLLEDGAQPMWRRLWWHAQDLCSPTSKRVMRSVLERVQPDWVMTHNVRGMGLSIVRPLRFRAWMHMLHDVQLLVPSGLWWLTRSSLWQSVPVRTLYQWWTRHCLRSPRVVVGVSQFILDAHQEAGFFPASTLAMLHAPVAPVPALGAELEAIEDLRLLFVGQLETHKGLQVILEALRHVTGSVTLDVVGEGTQQRFLMELAGNLPGRVRTRFHGRLAREEVFAYLRACDALVVPSVVLENCPGVVLEARQVGARVLAARTGGVVELVPEAALVEPGNVRAWAQAIEDVRHGGIPRTSPTALLSTTEHVQGLLAFMTDRS